MQKSAKMMTLEPDEQELLISCPLGALPTIIIPAPSSSFRLTRSFNALMKGSASMALKSRADFFLLMFSWLMTISLAEIIGSSGEHHFPKIEKGSPGDPGWSWLDFFPKRKGKTPGKWGNPMGNPVKDGMHHDPGPVAWRSRASKLYLPKANLGGLENGEHHQKDGKNATNCRWPGCQHR